jgi:hypothetical protein
VIDILIFAGFAVSVLTLGIGMWAFGQWLRGKGYGPQLDQLGHQHTALQLKVSPLALSATYHMIAGVQNLNRLPLLGSQSNAALNQQILLAVRAAQTTQKDKANTG